MFIFKFAASPLKNDQAIIQWTHLKKFQNYQTKPMDPVRINVLESYDLKFCCVCVQNGDSSYLNIFENVISYQNVYVSLAQIIEETLQLHVSRLRVNI